MTENAASILNAPEQLENDSFFRHGRARPGHPRLSCAFAPKTWMPGTRPGMTTLAITAYSIGCISSQALQR
jgi:hypothetical protein